MRKVRIPLCLAAGLLGRDASSAFRQESHIGVRRRVISTSVARSWLPLQHAVQHQYSWQNSVSGGASPFVFSKHQSKRRLLSSSRHDDDNRQENDKDADIDFLRDRKRTRTWKRLRHLVDLAAPKNIDSNDEKRSIADVGTDHGLLALALALSGNFDSVVGVDVSHQALKDGALSMMEQLYETELLEKNTMTLPLSFRHSDGLKNLEPGEADIVCLAGMGANTMRSILLSDQQVTTTTTSTQDIIDLDRLNCQQLILQPTNSRPRNLMALYDGLQQTGWSLDDERIEKLSSRWYITSSFVRKMVVDDKFAVAGSQLAANHGVDDDGDNTKQVWEDYVQHHIRWIQKDASTGESSISDADRRWLEVFDV